MKHLGRFMTSMCMALAGLVASPSLYAAPSDNPTSVVFLDQESNATWTKAPTVYFYENNNNNTGWNNIYTLTETSSGSNIWYYEGTCDKTGMTNVIFRANGGTSPQTKNLTLTSGNVYRLSSALSTDSYAGTTPKLTLSKTSGTTYYSTDATVTATSEVGATVYYKTWADGESEPSNYSTATDGVITLQTTKEGTTNLKVKTMWGSNITINEEASYTFTYGGDKTYTDVNKFIIADLSTQTSWIKLYVYNESVSPTIKYNGEWDSEGTMTNLSGNYYVWVYDGSKSADPEYLILHGTGNNVQTGNSKWVNGGIYKPVSNGAVMTASKAIAQSGQSSTFYVQGAKVTLTSNFPSGFTGYTLQYKRVVTSATSSNSANATDSEWTTFTSGQTVELASDNIGDQTTIYTRAIIGDNAYNFDSATYTYAEEVQNPVIAIRGYKGGASSGFYPASETTDVYDWVLTQDPVNKNVFHIDFGSEGITLKDGAQFSLVDGENTVATIHKTNTATADQGAKITTGNLIDHGQYFVNDFWWNADPKFIQDGASTKSLERPAYDSTNNPNNRSAFWVTDGSSSDTQKIYSATVFRVEGMAQSLADPGYSITYSAPNIPQAVMVTDLYYIYFDDEERSVQKTAPFYYYIWGSTESYTKLNDNRRLTSIPTVYTTYTKGDKKGQTLVSFQDNAYVPCDLTDVTIGHAVCYKLSWNGHSQSSLYNSDTNNTVNGVEYILTGQDGNQLSMDTSMKMLFVDASASLWIRGWSSNQDSYVNYDTWMVSSDNKKFMTPMWHNMSNFGGESPWDAKIASSGNVTQVRLWSSYNKSIQTTLYGSYTSHSSFNYRLDTFDATPKIEVTDSWIYDTSKGANTIVLGAKCKVSQLKPMYDDDDKTDILPMKVWVWANRKDGSGVDLRLDVMDITSPTVSGDYITETSETEYAVPTFVYSDGAFSANEEFESYRVQIDYIMKDGSTNQFGPYYYNFTPSLPKVESVVLEDLGKTAYNSTSDWKAVSYNENQNVAWGNTLKFYNNGSEEYPILKNLYQYTPAMKFKDGVGNIEGTAYDDIYAMLADAAHQTTYDKYFHVIDYASGKTLKSSDTAETINCYISSNTKGGKYDANVGKYCYWPSSVAEAQQAKIDYYLDTYLVLNTFSPEYHEASDTNPGWDGNNYFTVPSKAHLISQMQSDDYAPLWTYTALADGQEINTIGQNTVTVPDPSWITPTNTVQAIEDFSTLADAEEETSSSTSSNSIATGRPDVTKEIELPTPPYSQTLNTYLTNKDCASAKVTTQDFPTGVDNVVVDDDSNVAIYGTDGAIVVSGAKSYNVYTPSGALIYTGSADSVDMPAGVYIVSTSKGKNAKVQVK